ncbi:MAG: 4a-hydroxytetrahydrobiopterin dehydratase [Nevskia sp.]
MTTTTNKLTERRCLPCEGGVAPLRADQSAELLKSLRREWQLSQDGKRIAATFEFKNYFRTLAFVNAAAYIAISEDHHPDIAFGYKTCTISYWTHNIDGLSENDFICAAKIDALLN